ncbi:hypothetical protein vseg_001077 [Gypsophila vaccaria]
MMTSSGLGPYRVGGLGSLSSSSNLSPLAAPFKVEKSLQKQNSTNTSVGYPDMPMYGPYFEPPGQLWNHSSSSMSGSSFVETESIRNDNTCASSPAVYEYSVSQPSNAVAGAYHAASGSAAAYDPFSYGPFQNPMSSTSKDGVQPYYSPYVSPTPQKDGYLSSGINSGHGFDLFSNSTNAQLGGCGSSASDHLQGRPGDGDNKLHWGFWSEVNGQEKWSENAPGFGIKNSNLSDSLISKSPFAVDGINKSQPSVVVHTHPFTDGSSNNNIPDVGNTSNLKQDGCFDIFGGTYCLGSLGMDQQDSRSLSDCLRLPTSVPSLTPKESTYQQDEIVQSVTNFCGSQKENGLSSRDHFGLNDFYVFGCTSTPSTYPITKNKLPYGENSTSAEGPFSAFTPNPKVRVEGNQSNISARHDNSYPIEPHMSLGMKRQSKIVIRRPSTSSVMPSSSSSYQTRESLDNRIVGKDVSEEDQVSPKVPHLFSSNGLGMEVNDAQAAFSVEKLSGGCDVHNSAEDSPCWKGASLNRISSTAVTKAMDPDVFAKKMDEWESLNTRVSQVQSCLVDTSTCRDLFSEKSKEGNLLEKPFVSESVSNDNKNRYYVIQPPLCFDLNAGAGLQFGDEDFVSTKECHILNNPETDIFPGITQRAEQISEGKKIPSPRQLSIATPSEGSGKLQPNTTHNSFGVPPSSKNDHAISSPGDTASLKHCEETSKSSDAVDVNMLLKAMINLSEIFRSYCFSKRASVPEQHCIAIKRVISNLNASMLMMAGETSSTMLSSEINSSENNKTDAQKVTGAACEALAAAIKLGDSAGLLDSVSSKDRPNTDEDGYITEALKKILHDNFHEEEEMDQQQLLYKNLWLDAEASLCAMTAKARFLRVKAEMERPHDGAKDREIPSSNKNYGDVQPTVGLATCYKDPSVPSNCQKTSAISESNSAEEPEMNKCHIPNIPGTMNSVESEVRNSFQSLPTSKLGNTGNDFDGSGSTNHDNDAETSVMARYQILKKRIESSEAPIQERKESSEGQKNPLSFGDAMGADNPVLTKHQTLKCRVNHESLNNECISSLGEDNYMPDRESSSPKYQILESATDNSDFLYEVRDSRNSHMLSNSVGASEVGEASIMSRFRIIQSRMNQSDTIDKSQITAFPVTVLEDGAGERLFSGRALGPYPEFTEDGDGDEDVSQFRVPVHGEVFMNPYFESNRLNGEILESWFDNNGSSADWEHVSKEDLRRPN